MRRSDEQCRRFERLETARASGGVLTELDRLFLEQHATACQGCRAEAAAAALMRHSDDSGPARPLDEVSRRRFVNFVVTQAAAEGPAVERRQVGERRGWRYRWVAAAAVLLAVGVGVGIAMRGPSSKHSMGISGAPTSTARLLLRSGEVRVDGADVDLKARLAPGKAVRVRKGHAVLGLPDEASVLLSAEAAVRLTRLTPRLTILHLEQGELLASVKPRRHRRRFVVTTREGRVEVTGTVFWVRVDPDRVSVQVLRGRVRVVETGRPARLLGRGQTTLMGTVDRSVRGIALAQERRTRARLAFLELTRAKDAAGVRVLTRPAGAAVSVDGVVIGHTPLVASLGAGHRRLEIRSAGRPPIREQLTLRAGEQVRRDYELARPVVAARTPGADKGTGDAVAPTPAERVGGGEPGDSQRPDVMEPVVIRNAPLARRSRAGVTRHATAVAAAATAKALLRRAQKRRLARDWRGAAAAYRLLLREHPRSAASRASRVALGLLLLDHLGNPKAALQLFGVYLRQTRRGVLAQEAAYGRIRALRRLGRSKAEIAALGEFLKYYPGALQAPELRRRLKRLRAQGTRP